MADTLLDGGDFLAALAEMQQAANMVIIIARVNEDFFMWRIIFSNCWSYIWKMDWRTAGAEWSSLLKK